MGLFTIYRIYRDNNYIYEENRANIYIYIYIYIETYKINGGEGVSKIQITNLYSPVEYVLPIEPRDD